MLDNILQHVQNMDLTQWLVIAAAAVLLFKKDKMPAPIANIVRWMLTPTNPTTPGPDPAPGPTPPYNITVPPAPQPAPVPDWINLIRRMITTFALSAKDRPAEDNRELRVDATLFAEVPNHIETEAEFKAFRLLKKRLRTCEECRENPNHIHDEEGLI